MRNDGGFERKIAGGGLGWQQRDVTSADFDFDTDEKHSGSRSARLIFDGTQNLAYEGLFQLVLVSPGTHYRLQGFLRTDQISTESTRRAAQRISDGCAEVLSVAHFTYSQRLNVSAKIRKVRQAQGSLRVHHNGSLC